MGLSVGNKRHVCGFVLNSLAYLNRRQSYDKEYATLYINGWQSVLVDRIEVPPSYALQAQTRKRAFYSFDMSLVRLQTFIIMHRIIASF